MEPISLVTLKSRPCARLPPWRPRRSRASLCPRHSRLPSPGNLAGSQSPEPSSVPGRPGEGGSPASPERGAPSGDPVRPAAPRPRRPNKAGGGGGGGVRAAFPGLSPRGPAALGCPGLNDRDAAGGAPAGAEGSGPGRWLPRTPHSRPPAAARALAGDAQVSVGAEPGCTRTGLGWRAGVTGIPVLRPPSWISKEAGSESWKTKMRAT